MLHADNFRDWLVCRSSTGMGRPASKRSGFTLVELALTTVAIGLGMLAVFGLGRLGMQNAADTENDARCALLANDILATLRTASDDVCKTGGPAAFALFWTALRDDANARVEFPAAGGTALTNRVGSAATDGCIRGGGTVARVLLGAPTVLDDEPIGEWSARFWVSVELTSTLTARSGEPNLAYVSLNIRPDAFSERGGARSFYSHVAARTLWP